MSAFSLCWQNSARLADEKQQDHPCLYIYSYCWVCHTEWCGLLMHLKLSTLSPTLLNVLASVTPIRDFFTVGNRSRKSWKKNWFDSKTLSKRSYDSKLITKYIITYEIFWNSQIFNFDYFFIFSIFYTTIKLLKSKQQNDTMRYAGHTFTDLCKHKTGIQLVHANFLQY